jgi:hypothetical protein
MGNTFDRQVSMRKKASDAMTRLDGLESEVDDLKQSFPRFAMGVQSVTSKINNEISDLREIVDAIIQLVGPSKVQRVMIENRLTKLQADADASSNAIAKKVEDGQLAKGDKVTESSLIVGRESNADGTVIEPGYASFVFGQVHQAFKEKLLNQSVGSVVELNDGHKFEVLEIYVEVPKAPVETVVAQAPALEVVPAVETQAGA